jgi:UDP-N-acetylmuramyl pentapeptide phosphotransferase/UDP-N-acetylglucosamine-1-phosphate transferase
LYEGGGVTFPLVTTALAAAGASTAISVLIVLSQNWHGKHTLDHDLDGVQKFHAVAVPRIGGLAIISAVALALLTLWLGFDSSENRNVGIGALLLCAGFPVFAAGITEDVTKKVSVRIRLFASILSALLASWLIGATVDELNIWGVDELLRWTPLALLVTAVTVAGGVNAINIIDGFNGLASSTVMIMLGALACIGWQVGDELCTQLAVLGLAAAGGFFIVNFPTGRLFLGDGGAYFLGFWTAEIVVLLLVRDPGVNAWQLLSVCAYPVIEVLYSIYRRKFLRQASPGDPDALHLHTLIYRRAVSRLLSKDGSRPWARNAAVCCMVAPPVVIAALLTVVLGEPKGVSMALVFVQVVAYLTVYGRLVRGKWRSTRSPLRHSTSEQVASKTY